MFDLNIYKLVRNVRRTNHNDVYAAVVIAATTDDAREVAASIRRPGNHGEVGTTPRPAST